MARNVKKSFSEVDLKLWLGVYLVEKDLLGKGYPEMIHLGVIHEILKKKSLSYYLGSRISEIHCSIILFSWGEYFLT